MAVAMSGTPVFENESVPLSVDADQLAGVGVVVFAAVVLVASDGSGDIVVIGTVHNCVGGVVGRFPHRAARAVVADGHSGLRGKGVEERLRQRVALLRRRLGEGDVRRVAPLRVAGPRQPFVCSCLLSNYTQLR